MLCFSSEVKKICALTVEVDVWYTTQLLQTIE